MSGFPFDRRVLNQRERPLSSDLNTEFSQADRTDRRILDTLCKKLLNNVTGQGAAVNQKGFLADSFMVLPTTVPSLAVSITAGIGFQRDTVDVVSAIGGILGLDDLDSCKPLVLNASQSIAITPDPGNPRIDIVTVKFNRLLGESASRDVLDPGTGVFSPTLVNKNLGWSLDGLVSSGVGPGATPIFYKTGTPGAVPVAPTADAGYVKIAEVQVPAAAASITRGNIKDTRFLWTPYGNLSFGGSFIMPNGAGGAPSGLLHSGPPGVRVVIVKTGVDLGTIYVLVPDNYLNGTVSVTGGFLGLGSLGYAVTTATGTVLAADKTAIEGAGATPAGVLVAGPAAPFTAMVGQRMFSAPFAVEERSGGGFGALTGSRLFHFTIDIRDDF